MRGESYMRGRPGSVRSLEELGRVRLSASFCMRDFLHSEIADFHGIPDIPDAQSRPAYVHAVSRCSPLVL